MTKVLFAGSHAGTTAISIINEIKNKGFDWEISFIGKKWATEEKKSFTLEYQELPKLNVNFYPVESGKIQTKFTKYTLLAILKIPFGFLYVGFLIFKIRPNVLLSFGGAAGFLSVFWSWVFRIPIIVHEQTAVAGRANLVSSKFANIVAISRLSSKKYFDNCKIAYTGNPISSEINKYLDLKPKKRVKTIFITGGSRGSKWINDAFIPLVYDLVKKYKIVWQCGVEELKRLNIKNPNLALYGRIDPNNFIKLLSDSDLVIGRSGGNTVSELVALKKPCILIPIPWSYLDEQNENAKYLENLGLAKIILQENLNHNSLRKEINNIITNYENIIKTTRNVKSYDLNASGRLIDLIKSLL